VVVTESTRRYHCYHVQTLAILFISFVCSFRSLTVFHHACRPAPPISSASFLSYTPGSRHNCRGSLVQRRRPRTQTNARLRGSRRSCRERHHQAPLELTTQILLQRGERAQVWDRHTKVASEKRHDGLSLTECYRSSPPAGGVLAIARTPQYLQESVLSNPDRVYTDAHGHGNGRHQKHTRWEPRL
jgi:hypothetical protein